MEACLWLASGHGFDLPAIIDVARSECALMLGQHITGKPKNRRKNPMCHLASEFKKPFEILQWIDRELWTD